MANANTAKGLAYLNALAGMHKPVQTYVGNNPFNVAQHKVESATDIEMSKIKLKTERIKQENMKQSGALDVARMGMLQEKHAWEKLEHDNAIQTEADLTNNMGLQMFESDTLLTEDKQTQKDVTSKEVSQTDADRIAAEFDKATSKRTLLTDDENDFLKRVKEINTDITLTDNDRVEAKMKLGKQFKYIKQQQDGTAEEGNIFHQAVDNIADIIPAIGTGIGVVGDTLWRSNKEVKDRKKEVDQFFDFNKEYNGTNHQDNLSETIRGLKSRRKQNQDIFANASREKANQTKKAQKDVTKIETITKKDVLRDRADVAAETKQDVMVELNKIQSMKITIGAKNKLKASVIGAYQRKMTKYDAKVSSASEIAKEARKSLIKMNEERAKIEEQMLKEISVNANKDSTAASKAKLKETNLKIKKLEKEIKATGGWFS